MESNKKFLVAVSAVCLTVAAGILVHRFVAGGRQAAGRDAAVAPVTEKRSGSAKVIREDENVQTDLAQKSLGSESRRQRHARQEEPFETTLSAEDFELLLLGIGDESIETRRRAWREIANLRNAEKIYWLRQFIDSDSVGLRLASMKALRGCFGMAAFHRKAKSTYKDMKARQKDLDDGKPEHGGGALVPVDASSLPTKEEASQINGIVRRGMKDESGDVRHEAVVAASSFDIDTCHVLYQYGMTSCSDDVRLDILRDAEYGDEDFKLRLQMAALDVGGEEVAKAAADGIAKATGRHFANSEEALEWYEENRTNDNGLELVIGEPGDER